MKKPSLAQSAMPDQPSSDAAPGPATIESMGAQGHGIAHIGGEKHFIPFTLPGERIRVEFQGQRPVVTGHRDAVARARRATLQALWRLRRMRPAALGGGAIYGVETGACNVRAGTGRDRCAHRAAAKLSRIEPPPRHLHGPQIGGKIALGYNAARSHDLVDLEECPVLLPQIAQALPHLRAALRAAMPAKSEAKVSITAAANGLDCAIEGPSLRASANAKVIDALGAAGIIRAIWNGESRAALPRRRSFHPAASG